MTATTNMVFSESTNKTGMYELFQDLTSSNSTSYSAYKFARDINNALAHYFLHLALPSTGKWQIDDSNQTAEAVISRNLVANTYSYAMTTDDATSANQVLEIERVEMATSSAATSYNVLYPYDEMDSDDQSITFGRTITGVPYRYAKRNNYIYLDPTPNFSATAGLKVFISRTTTYFAGTDTTKVVGIPHAHQEYLVYRAAYFYCVRNIPEIANGYLNMVNVLEKKIKLYYSGRDKDDHKVVSTFQPNFM